MSRHINHLEHLCADLQQRYGAMDPLFQQVSAELEAKKRSFLYTAPLQNWSLPYRAVLQQRRQQLLDRTH